MRYACALLMLLSIAPLATPAQKKKSPVKIIKKPVIRPKIIGGGGGGTKRVVMT